MYLDLIDLLIKVTKNSNCYDFVNKFLAMYKHLLLKSK